MNLWHSVVAFPACPAPTVPRKSGSTEMGLIASRGIEYEDSYRSFSEKERQLLSSLFDKLATANEHGVMKVELGPFKVSASGKQRIQACTREPCDVLYINFVLKLIL